MTFHHSLQTHAEKAASQPLCPGSQGLEPEHKKVKILAYIYILHPLLTTKSVDSFNASSQILVECQPNDVC